MNNSNISKQTQPDHYDHVPNIAEPREGRHRDERDKPRLQGAYGLVVGRWNVEAGGI